MLLLCGNLSSRSPENFHTIIKDSDSNREEIDIFFGPDDLIPPAIECDIDSEEDIIDNLLNDDPILEFERLTTWNPMIHAKFFDDSRFGIFCPGPLELP
ncbi:hypothetical protein Tco_0794161 [Tanacetum coccineum]